MMYYSVMIFTIKQFSMVNKYIMYLFSNDIYN